MPVGISVEYEAVKHAKKKLLNDNAAKTALFFRSKFALCSKIKIKTGPKILENAEVSSIGQCLTH